MWHWSVKKQAVTLSLPIQNMSENESSYLSPAKFTLVPVHSIVPFNFQDQSGVTQSQTVTHGGPESLSVHFPRNQGGVGFGDELICLREVTESALFDLRKWAWDFKDRSQI